MIIKNDKINCEIIHKKKPIFPNAIRKTNEYNMKCVKLKMKIMFKQDLNNVIHYQQKKLQLTKEGENKILNQNGLPSNQHMGIPMQVLYEETL